jgi:PPOX class probable F420-dependent enzyme
VAPLTAAQLELLHGARRAVLATIAPDGGPRLVPITYAFDISGDSPVLYSPLDEKHKSVADPRDLARVRDIQSRPRVSVLVDRWSEQWSELTWLRLQGSARVIGPDEQDGADHAHALGLLRARYPQYAEHALEQRPMIRVTVDRATSWSAG